MSNDKRETGDRATYSTPSFAIDLLATFIALALVYGMIALVGNASAPQELRAASVSDAGPRGFAGRNGQNDKSATGKANAGNRGAGSLQVATMTRPSKTATESLPAGKTGAELAGFVRGKLAAFALHKTPLALPEFTYVDEKGAKYSLKDLHGKVVLLNLWATWCGPCRHEMPWLDQLKGKFRDRQFEVLAISIDRGGLEKPRRFFDQIKIRNLALYGDPTGRLAAKLRAFGMPTTILIDRAGRELGRIAGPAEWASSDAIAFIEAAIGQENP